MKKTFSLLCTLGLRISLILVAILGIIYLDGSRHELFALTAADCRVCHTGDPDYGGLYGPMMPIHHSHNRACGSCHFGAAPKWTDPDDPGYNCLTCHYTGTWVWNALDVYQAHESRHDKTDTPSVFCSECHTANVYDEHLSRSALIDEEGDLSCKRCHSNTHEEIQNAILLGQGEEGQTVFCTDCHGFSMHGADHDSVSFTGDEQDCASCSSCHYCVMTGGVATEHIMRGFNCVTCHSNQDPAVQDAITLGRGEFGQLIICVDCHYQSREPYDIHVEAHNIVCNVCHKLPEQGDGSLTSIHETNTSYKVGCSDCHRQGNSDLDKNTIFSVQVNNDPSEPPDYDYAAGPYLNGPCLKCHEGHKNNKTSCNPCHFATPYDGWPEEANGYNGSETWGHNFQLK